MILIVGANGLLGRALVAAFATAGLAVLRASHRLGADLRLDLTRAPGDQLARLPAGISHAIVCSAVTDVDACGRDPSGTARFNVTHTLALLEALARRGVRAVFCSSDMVFDGTRGDYREDDARGPATTYGRQKAAVEDTLLGGHEGALVVRLSKLFSLDADDTSPIRATLAALRDGRRVRAARDQVIAPTFAGDVAAAVRDLVVAGASGVFHLAPPPSGRATRATLARTLARLVGREDLVDECALGDLPFVEPRPHDTSLDTAKWVAWSGRPLPTLAEYLPAIAARVD